MAASLQRHAPEVIAGGDEEGAQVGAAEGAVAACLLVPDRRSAYPITVRQTPKHIRVA
jgi:hypothetical protein